MESPAVPWPPGTPRAATAGANAGTSSARQPLHLRRRRPAPNAVGSVARRRTMPSSAGSGSKTTSVSPPFTAVTNPPTPRTKGTGGRRHISSPRTSVRPDRLRLTDALSQTTADSQPPGSATSSMAVTWDSLAPPDAGGSTVTTERSEEENVFLRRYFFTERGYETDRMPAQKHFDVVMPDAPPEYVSDHLYCRYVDFLKEGNAPSAHELGLLDPTTDAPNTLRIAEWLRKAHPRTRLDACPMFFLAKQVLTNLMDGEVAQANQRIALCRIWVWAQGYVMRSGCIARYKADVRVAAPLSPAATTLQHQSRPRSAASFRWIAVLKTSVLFCDRIGICPRTSSCLSKSSSAPAHTCA